MTESGDQTAHVLVEPGGLLIPARSGETIMAAAHRAGFYWPTSCGGQGTCRVCFVEIESGTDNLDPAAPAEIGELERLAMRRVGSLRLACQAIVRGEVKLRKRGVKALGTT